MTKAKVTLISMMMAFVLIYETAKTTTPVITETPKITEPQVINEGIATSELSAIKTRDPDEITDTISTKNF